MGFLFPLDRPSEDWILTASKIRRLESEGLLPSGPAPKRNSIYIDAVSMIVMRYHANEFGPLIE